MPPCKQLGLLYFCYGPQAQTARTKEVQEPLEWAGALGTLARAVGWQVQGKGGNARVRGVWIAVRQGVVFSAALLPGIFSCPFFLCLALLLPLLFFRSTLILTPTALARCFALVSMVVFFSLRFFSHAPPTP